MAGRKSGDDGLSDDDRRLWWRVAQTVEPLPGRRHPDVPRKAETPDPEIDETPVKPARRVVAPSAAQRPPAPGPKAVTPGSSADMDRRLAQRFRRGQLAIDARYDLHGMRQREAHAALNAFLAGAQARGCRCILVITGKGQRAPLEERTGILKAQLPRWLNEAPNRGRILAVTTAQPKHGGEGAFYILLKKLR
jgi:DNA-nicking Smr family endonuclease